jgi:hypothetical protein
VQNLLGLSNEQAIQLSWAIVNGSITKLLFKNGHVSLSYFNDFGFLEQTDPQLVTYR